MIIPTAEYDPMFAEDGISFRTKMLDYIRREFGEVLGPRLGLLRSEKGLEALAGIYRIESREAPERKAA